MGIFEAAKSALNQVQKSFSSGSTATEVQVVFGQNYISKCNHIIEEVKAGRWRGGTSLSITFDNSLVAEIEACISEHRSSDRVLYTDDSQFLDVVGESFIQEQLRNLHSSVGENWIAGFLMPQPLNPHDPNAIAVIAISPNTDPNSGEKFAVTQVGYLSKDQAKKFNKKVTNFCEQDAYIPVVCKLAGGTVDRPNYGLIARAKTNKIKS